MIDNITTEAAHCSTEAHRGHEMRVRVTLSVFAMEIVGTLLSILGLKLNAVEHPRPTHQRGHADFSLSRSVLSIIHEMCLLFFLDPLQHNTSPTAWFPSHAGLPVQWGSNKYFQLLSRTSDLTQRVSLLYLIWILQTLQRLGFKQQMCLLAICYTVCQDVGEMSSRSYRLQIVRLLLCSIHVFPYW